MAPLNVRAARLGVVEDERHGLELDDQGQTMTCAGMALKIKASNEDDYLRSTDQPRQWGAGRARARRSGVRHRAGSAGFEFWTLESVPGQPVLNLSKYKNVRSLFTLVLHTVLHSQNLCYLPPLLVAAGERAEVARLGALEHPPALLDHRPRRGQLVECRARPLEQ